MPGATLAAEGDTVVINGTTLTPMHFNPEGPDDGPDHASALDIAVYYGPDYSGTGTVTADITGAM